MSSHEIPPRIAESFARQALMHTLGAELDHAGMDCVRISAPVTDAVRQQHGVAHAGLTFALADSAAGYAAMMHMPDGAEVMSVEMKINMMAPADGTRLIAEGRVLKAGRRLHVVQAEVTSQGGPKGARMVAMVQGTMIVIEP